MPVIRGKKRCGGGECQQAEEKGNPKVCNSRGGPGDTMLTQRGQLEKDKYRLVSLICGI